MRNTGPGSNRIVVLLTALLIAVGLTGLTTTAIAGNGQPGSHHHHHHKKKCPAGTHKVVVFKHGKKKRKCVADPPAPKPGTPAALTITPGNVEFPGTEHGGLPCPSCPTQDFTVRNAGGSTSGALTSSITDTADPNPGDDPAFSITQNGCTAALPSGKTCNLTVTFAPPSNAGDEHYASVLHVAGSPGGDVQAQMSGDAQ